MINARALPVVKAGDRTLDTGGCNDCSARNYPSQIAFASLERPRPLVEVRIGINVFRVCAPCARKLRNALDDHLMP